MRSPKYWIGHNFLNSPLFLFIKTPLLLLKNRTFTFCSLTSCEVWCDEKMIFFFIFNTPPHVLTLQQSSSSDPRGINVKLARTKEEFMKAKEARERCVTGILICSGKTFVTVTQESFACKNIVVDEMPLIQKTQNIQFLWIKCTLYIKILRMCTRKRRWFVWM